VQKGQEHREKTAADTELGVPAEKQKQIRALRVDVSLPDLQELLWSLGGQ